MVKTDFIDELKNSTGNEFTIFIGDKRANTSIIRNGERAVGTTLDPKIAKIVLEEQKVYSGQTDILNVLYSVSYKPIIDGDGNSIGVLFAGVPLKELMAVKNTIILSSIFIVLTIIIIIILALIRVVKRKITNPIKALCTAAENLSVGNLNYDNNLRSSDEFGILADTFQITQASLKSYINDISDKLKQMKSGDMQIRIDLDYAGDFKVIKQSIEEIASSLNSTLLNISTAAGQVKIGAEQVSAGAQGLSTGSTQQAANVEDLNAFVIKIADEATRNSENVKLASKYIFEAENGVNAGNAGKGFAVVAEEVRNLAAKSSEAAKQTAILIQASVDAVKNGTDITEKTSNMLKSIKTNTVNVTENFERVEIAIDEQAKAIEQVKEGISQISTVVQNNAATAEENSATSEEMSAQATALSQEVEKFKLNNNY